MQPKPDVQTLGLILSGHLREFDWEAFPPEDWDQLNKRALQEGVAPLLYWQFSKSELLPVLPATTRNFLRVSYASTWMRNQRYLKELQILSQLFTRAEIPFILLKGICYILTIYPDIGLRPMGDIDLLVPHAKLEHAVTLAKSLDYDDILPEASPGLNDLLNHEICLHKKEASSIALELHYSLVADKTFSYAVPVDWFWEHSEPLDTQSTGANFGSLLMLSPDAQVLYAASHAMLQHGGQAVSLCWYYDMDRLIHLYKERLDWESLISQASRFEWGSALNAALEQTYKHFHTPIPATVLSKLSAQTDRHARLVTLKQAPPATHTLQEYQKLLSLGWYGRLRLVMALLFPSPSYMMWRYALKSTWKLPVYYPVRWWGILKDMVCTVRNLVRRQA